MEIALISDTHSDHLEEDVIHHLKDCDEVWHAGDLGTLPILEYCEQNYTFRSVYGNIDGRKIRRIAPLDNVFEVEGVKVYITHIGGYPGRYTKRVREKIVGINPDLYICGHSHICKVMRDKKLNLIHMNPGACGHVGFHTMRTMLKFSINNGKIDNLRVVELGLRGIKVKPNGEISQF